MGLGLKNNTALQTPLLLWQQMARMALESQMVIALRTAGMVGMLPQDAAEPHRMVLEKADAASEALQAALRAAGRGARADRIVAAAIRPYRRRTRANMRRLAARKD
ncbi:antibiotic ABC transporter [Paracoccus sp. (in: a-proteobacteria)]|uniref:antibiotic ABC transporter n=1 Tax=Paracoccus sp. TaxID=267 RepID=UPI003220152C